VHPESPALLTVQPLDSPAEEVAVELPVALAINEVSQAVMLATPADLEDFAVGLALAEGWLQGVDELLDLETQPAPEGLVVQMRVTAQAEQRVRLRRRTLAGRTGCGLCGVESLAALADLEVPRVQALLLDAATLTQGMRALQQAQVLNARCGGLHGAACIDATGHLLLAREDVGRHNALDKVVGALARQGRSGAGLAFLVSSRASVELVQKVARAEGGLLACVSAPSHLAIETARRAGLPLWAFVREGRATRYA
jgi:FdhD protein